MTAFWNTLRHINLMRFILDVNTLHVIFPYYIILYCIPQNALLYLKTHIVCDF